MSSKPVKEISLAWNQRRKADENVTTENAVSLFEVCPSGRTARPSSNFPRSSGGTAGPSG
jgi:hypothetical protein